MRQPSVRAPHWPALLLLLLPGLLAPKGCYFGERNVPLGGNRDPGAGGQSADDAGDTGDTSDTSDTGDTSATGDGGDSGSDTTGASGNGGAGSIRPGTEMRTPGVFQVH